MKKSALLFVIIVLSLVAASSVLGQEGEMTCPGHDGNTIASLQLCVAHAAAEGHIANQGVAASLSAKLTAAQQAVNRGQPAVALNILNSFISEVRALAGTQIHDEHAQHMIEHAERVIAALGG